MSVQPLLRPAERAAAAEFTRAVVQRMPLWRLVLFGSKARGDHDPWSDLDLLLLATVPLQRREEASRVAHAVARRVEGRFDVELSPWLVPTSELRVGRRTPMLVDSVADGVILWPPGSPPLTLPFTPHDALFCADRLLEWVEEGGGAVRRELEDGAVEAAAQRIRDDIVRMATAALLLLGDTRHRRVETLRRFEDRLVATGRLPKDVVPALRWARAAFPPDGGRGGGKPPVTRTAARSWELGFRVAARIEERVVPWIRAGMARLAEGRFVPPEKGSADPVGSPLPDLA